MQRNIIMMGLIVQLIIFMKYNEGEHEKDNIKCITNIVYNAIIRRIKVDPICFIHIFISLHFHVIIVVHILYYYVTHES